MNECKGEIFSIAAENAPVDGCTVSKAVAEVVEKPFKMALLLTLD